MNWLTGDNRPYHGITAPTGEIAAAIPLFARRVLVVAAHPGATLENLSTRPHVTSYAIAPPEAQAEPGLSHAGAVLDPDVFPLPFPAGYFDAVAGELHEMTAAGVVAFVAKYGPLAQENAAIVLSGPATARDSITHALQATGWQIAHLWRGGSEQDGGFSQTILRLGRIDYDARSHARNLFEAGNPAAAYDLLCLLPEQHLQDAHTTTAIAIEALLYLAATPCPDTPAARLSRFARAYWLFSIGAAALPDDTRAGTAMADVCEQTGCGMLGARLRRTVAYAQQEPPKSAAAAAAPPNPATTRPPASARNRFKSVLLLTRNQPDYGLDTLYDGLCDVLGDMCVTEYPFKPSLHAPGAATGDYYPTTHQRAGVPMDCEAICSALQAGAYDLILFGDCTHDIPREVVQKILSANTTVPVVIVDQGDSPVDDFLPLSAYLARDDVVACFKREKLAGIPYHPRVHPLPFAYPESRIPSDTARPRQTPFFWAGNRNVWLRVLYTNLVENVLGTSLNESYTQEEYAHRLLDAQISASFFGGGFDSVRYWEIPAHGSLLLAERPPIEIPDNFQDGRHAVFFDDLAALEEKLRYYLHHPDEVEAIARAGHAHLRASHTAAVRARQLLSVAAAP